MAPRASSKPLFRSHFFKKLLQWIQHSHYAWPVARARLYPLSCWVQRERAFSTRRVKMSFALPIRLLSSSMIQSLGDACSLTNIKLNERGKGCGLGERSGVEWSRRRMSFTILRLTPAPNHLVMVPSCMPLYISRIQGRQLDESDRGIEVDGAPVYPWVNFWLFICLVLCISAKMNSEFFCKPYTGEYEAMLLYGLNCPSPCPLYISATKTTSTEEWSYSLQSWGNKESCGSRDLQACWLREAKEMR